MIKLYNTLTRKVEQLKPISPPTVTLYTCGPTVYDYLQIGNWLTFIRWDLLARTLKTIGYNPSWIMNITDVGHLVSDADEGEDKLEKGAKREGKTAWEIAEYYTNDFLEGLDALNISVPRDNLPKATDHIPEQIDLVKKLEAKGVTYTIDDGVYFDTNKFPDYGKLGNIDLKNLQTGTRMAENVQKRQPHDFALWKFSPDGQKRDMEWDSPWGKGFPGWHLECSVMAMKYLGETLDVHTGGIDHIHTHHNGEIAQSETATGKPFVRLWVHSNFLTVDGVKLSKSLGNSYTLQDIIKHGFKPLDFRIFAMQSQYRNEANFTWKGLEAAKNRLRAYQAMADLLWQPHASGITAARLTAARRAITEALTDDLNTPQALVLLSELEATIDRVGISVGGQRDFEEFLKWLDETLGLQLSERKDIGTKQKQLIAQREKARESKNWVKSDELRRTLEAQGIGVRDTPHGPVWNRT